MKLVSASLVLTLAAALGACVTTAPSVPAVSESDAQCALMVDLAQQMEVDNVDPIVGKDDSGRGLDCTRAFAAANLPMHPVDRGNIPANDAGWGHVTAFKRAQITGDTAVVEVDFVCLRLCGHGERVTLRNMGRYWKVTMRETTWIS